MQLACQIIILVLFLLNFLQVLMNCPNTMKGAVYALSLWLFVAFLYWQSGAFSEILKLLP